MKWEPYSWQEHLLGSVELREEPPSITLGAHDKGCPFQFFDRGFAISHLAELNPVLAKRLFKFGQAELHLENRWRERFAKTVCLFGGSPISEVRQRIGCVLDNDILYPILKAVCLGKNALDAGGVWGHHPDRREPDADCGDIFIHRVEPIGGDLPGSGSHISEDDLSAAVKMIHEGIETRWRVDIDLGHTSIEEVFQGTTSLVLCIEIEQRDGNLVGLKPFGQSDNDAGFAYPAFAAHGEDNTF
jgi:hypothetical protein